MEAQGVGLDHEAEVGAEEVDFEFVDDDFGFWRRHAGGGGDGAEEALEL